VATFFLLGCAYFVVARRRASGGWSPKIYGACCAAAIAYVAVLLLLPRDVVTGVATVAVVGAAILAIAVTWRIRARSRAGSAAAKPESGREQVLD
jgi:hypothetical protein